MSDICHCMVTSRSDQHFAELKPGCDTIYIFYLLIIKLLNKLEISFGDRIIVPLCNILSIKSLALNFPISSFTTFQVA